MPEEGEKRAYDHFMRSTFEKRRTGFLSPEDLDRHNLLTVKPNGDDFTSLIRSHVLYPSKNRESKDCKYGQYKTPGGVKCIKNPVHSIPGKSHHKVSGAGPGNPDADMPDDMQNDMPDDFGAGAEENEPEAAAPARNRKKKKAEERRSSRIKKYQGNYWERKSKRRELKRS